MPQAAQEDAPASRREIATAKVTDAYAAASAKTKDVIATVEGNPLAALLGGLALGAAIGALVPRSAKEKAMLEPLGQKIADAATAAIAAGREAGTKALDDSGFTSDGLREQVAKLVAQAGDAAAAVGTAAVDAARESVQG